MVAYSQPTALGHVISLLPEAVSFEINKLADRGEVFVGDISEIRLRTGRQASLSLDRVNYLLRHICSEGEMASVISKLCGGSVYACEACLKQGYISPGNGVRVAVNTRSRRTGTETVREATPGSVVFRIPIHTEGQSMPLARLMANAPGGMLIFAPPAVGKTTVLRDLVITLSGPLFSRRVAIIDTRDEIDDGLLPENCLADTLCGCERKEGIEWALRTLSPQLIAVDELSDADVDCVCRAGFCGVPVVATMHGDSFDDVLCRGAFNSAIRYFVRLTRKRGADPEFEVMAKDGNGGLVRVDI